MLAIDLHTHSNRSDGTFTPNEVVRTAADRGIDAVALVDHDTTEGLDEALAAGAELGVEVVPGVEFSAEYERTSVHVLCYWPDVASPEFQRELQRLRDDRLRRGELMIEKLQALGFDISFERVREIGGRRQHHPSARRAGDGRRGDRRDRAGGLRRVDRGRPSGARAEARARSVDAVGLIAGRAVSASSRTRGCGATRRRSPRS